jgi:hypothetical protein
VFQKCFFLYHANVKNILIARLNFLPCFRKINEILPVTYYRKLYTESLMRTDYLCVGGGTNKRIVKPRLIYSPFYYLFGSSDQTNDGSEISDSNAVNCNCRK